MATQPKPALFDDIIGVLRIALARDFATRSRLQCRPGCAWALSGFEHLKRIQSSRKSHSIALPTTRATVPTLRQYADIETATTKMGLRIVTWNVNGIRNPFGYQPWRDKRTFEGMFDILEADIVVFQETKIQRKDLRDDMVLVPGWDCYWSLPRHKKGKLSEYALMLS